MHPSISRSYIIPAIFLNPVLFLISINTILSRVLPPIMVDATVQPSPHTALGPSPEHPHLDIHGSESLCLCYTVLIVCAQLLAFGRVSERRVEGRSRANTKKERFRIDISSIGEKATEGMDDARRHTNGVTKDGALAGEVECKGHSITRGMNGFRPHANGVPKLDIANAEKEAYDSHVESDLESSTTEGSDGHTESTDSEIIF